MSRRGAALLIAIAAIAALGMISLTGFALARTERAAGLAAVAEVQARGAAETALADAMAGWSRLLTPSTPGQEVLLATVVLPGPATGQAVLRAMGGPVLSIRSSGVRRDAAGRPLAEIVLEQLVRLDSLAPDSLIHPKHTPSDGGCCPKCAGGVGFALMQSERIIAKQPVTGPEPPQSDPIRTAPNLLRCNGL